MHLRHHTKLAAPAQVEKYFIKRQSEAAYYSENQEFNGFWGGKAAKMLGLKDYMRNEEFSRLCHNLHPITGEQLTPRMKEKRRIGYDFNFNCPKSVSLVYAYTKDERIIQSVRQAIRETMEEMEMMIATRVRSGGRDEDRTTGSWVYAEFVHLTARPENGVPDPHLHSHCYVFNVTWDPVEKKFKAAQLGNLIEELDHFQGACAMRVKENLKKLGLEIVLTKDAFEIAGISPELRKKFSCRSETIEAKANKLGITDPAQKAKLAAMTRESKEQDLTIPELEGYWWPRLSPAEKEALEGHKTLLQRSRAVELSQQLVSYVNAGESSKALGTRQTLPKGKTQEIAASSDFLATKTEMKGAVPSRRQSMNQKTRPRQAVKETVKVTEHDHRAVALAMEHLFERESAVTEKKLTGEAFKSWCVGKATLEGIKQAVAEAPLIRREWNGRLFVTTEQVLAEEKRIADRCMAGKGQYEAMNSYWKIEDSTLNDEQREAVMHVLTSTDWITGIAGRAGVGKTTLLHEVRRGIQSGMYKLIALAPTSEAARDVLRKEGFTNAETVAKLLRSEKLQREARGAVLLVDEAGLLSTREADRLFELAAKLGARVVLVGDSKQHDPVLRGQVIEHLRREGGMEVAEVNKIQRQKGIHKQVVEQVMAGNIAGAIKTLKKLEWVFEMTLEERKVALANDYLFAVEHGNTALVVAPTHAECADVTEGIRDALKKKNVLKEGVEWDVLRNLSWTNAQKSDSDQYERGLVAQINGHVKGFALGEQVEVIGVRDGMVRVRCKDGYNLNIRALPLSEPEVFNVYERQKLEICEGDRLRVTENGRTADNHSINNKSIHTVDYIDHAGKIVLENGWKLDRNFKHLDYGYTLTSHAAQGKTVDWVFVAQSAQLSSCASDLKQFYVSMSRGRKGVKLYTDDLELLEENVSRVRERPMATEIMKERQSEERTKTSAKEEPAQEQSGKPFGAEGPRIAEELAEILREYVQGSPEREAEIEALSKHLGQEKEIERIERSLEMASPIPEREAGEFERQMEEAEREAEWELEM